MDSQEDFTRISPPSPDVQTDDDFPELFQQLKSKLVDMDLIQTIKDKPIIIFEIHGVPIKVKQTRGAEFYF